MKSRNNAITAEARRPASPHIFDHSDMNFEFVSNFISRLQYVEAETRQLVFACCCRMMSEGFLTDTKDPYPC